MKNSLFFGSNLRHWKIFPLSFSKPATELIELNRSARFWSDWIFRACRHWAGWRRFLRQLFQFPKLPISSNPKKEWCFFSSSVPSFQYNLIYTTRTCYLLLSNCNKIVFFYCITYFYKSIKHIMTVLDDHRWPMLYNFVQDVLMTCLKDMSKTLGNIKMQCEPCFSRGGDNGCEKLHFYH